MFYDADVRPVSTRFRAVSSGRGRANESPRAAALLALRANSPAEGTAQARDPSSSHASLRILRPIIRSQVPRRRKAAIALRQTLLPRLLAVRHPQHVEDTSAAHLRLRARRVPSRAPEREDL